MALWNRFVEKIKNTANQWTHSVSNLFSDSPLTEKFWDELEERLLSGDVGLESTESLIRDLRAVARDRNIAHTEQLRRAFAELLVQRFESVEGNGAPLRLASPLSVVILIGVNGSGKTTTCGKLASQLQQQGKKVLLAAADTYRAAAIDQLKAWGERVGVRVVAQNPGSDPAAVVFDAIAAARASGTEVVLADTAGRLHTKQNLMEELAKVSRVIAREIPEGPSEVLLVLDGVTGQNGFLQAREFGKAIPLSGVILTKFDNSAKGGVVIPIAEKLKLPIRYLGLGEGVDDLELFDPKSFVRALLDLKEEETNGDGGA